MTTGLSMKQAKAYVCAHSRVVQESVRQYPPWTFVEVTFCDSHSTNPKTGKPLSFKASAAVSLYHLDKWDAELGIEIAVGKARATLARKYRAWTKRQAKKEQMSERHVVDITIPPDKVRVTIVGV